MQGAVREKICVVMFVDNVNPLTMSYVSRNVNLGNNFEAVGDCREEVGQPRPSSCSPDPSDLTGLRLVETCFDPSSK